MTVRKIILYREDPEILHMSSRAAGEVRRKTRSLIRDLKDSLLHHPGGIGLAAPQINVHRRVEVVRLGARGGPEVKAGPPIALVDPEIQAAADVRRDFDGCLSFPGLYAQTARPNHLKVKGLDEAGEPFERELEGFDAMIP